MKSSKLLCITMAVMIFCSSLPRMLVQAYGETVKDAVVTAENEGDVGENEDDGEDTVEFEIDENGVLIKYHGEDDVVVIPGSVNDTAIMGIGSEAFSDCKDLVSITVPDSVTSIGERAFWGCSNLKTVAGMQNVTCLGNEAFWGCSSLSSIALGKVTSIQYGTFVGCDSLESLELPDSVIEIGNGVFSGCSSLSNLVIPNSVRSIGDFVFNGCSSLESIIIPASVTSIESNAFTIKSGLSIYGSRGSHAEEYAKRRNIEFAINLSGCTIEIAPESVIYNGEAQTVTVTVTDGDMGITLTEETDYTVAYSNNINAGTATITITGAGKKPQIETRIFEIQPYDISNCNIPAIDPPTVTYNGQEWRPGVKVEDRGKALVQGTDYTVAYSNNINVGTATATISGIGNYTGSVTRSFTIQGAPKPIDPIDINRCEVTLDSIDYDEDENTYDATITVTYYSDEDEDFYYELEEDTDYTLDSVTVINGTVTVTIIGIGNYKGTRTVSLKMKPEISVNLGLCDVDIDWDTLEPPDYEDEEDTEWTVDVTVAYYDGDEEDYVDFEEGDDYTVTVTVSDSANKRTVTVFINALSPHTGRYTATKTFDLTNTGGGNPPVVTLPQNKKSISNCTITLSRQSVTYTGRSQTVTVTVKDGNKTLQNGTDYTVAYSNNTNVGTATVTITGKGTYQGSVQKYFTITQVNTETKPETEAKPDTKSIANCTITLSPQSVTYTGQPQTVTVMVKDGNKTLKKGTDYTLKYSDNTNVGTATVTITGKGAYEGSVQKNFIIAPKKDQRLSTAKSLYNVAYGDEAFSLDVKREKGNGKLNYKSSDKKVVKVSQKGMVTIVGTGTATITVYAAESTKYKKSPKLKITVNVRPAKQKWKSIKIKNRRMNLTWTEDKMASGYEIWYSTDKEFKTDVNMITIKSRKTTSTTIKKLKKGMIYYVRVHSYKTVKVNGKNQKLYGSFGCTKEIPVGQPNDQNKKSM